MDQTSHRLFQIVARYALPIRIDGPINEADLGDQLFDFLTGCKALVELEPGVKEDRDRAVVLFDHVGPASRDPGPDYFRTTWRVDGQLAGP